MRDDFGQLTFLLVCLLIISVCYFSFFLSFFQYTHSFQALEFYLFIFYFFIFFLEKN
ncbi:hypothetical protein GGR50DRAFT_639823, partial [Xylaria sp. CBS 124048]